jgi:hypothetical protein
MTAFKTILAAICLTTSCAVIAEEKEFEEGEVIEVIKVERKKESLLTVPKLPGGFVIGGTGFYLLPSDSNGDFDYASVNNGTSSKAARVDPEYQWGWGAFIDYVIPNTGNDIGLGYFHYNNDNTDNHHGDSVTPLNVGVDGAETFDHVRATFDVEVNIADLTVGQFIDVTKRLHIHPTAGLRWGSITRTLKPTFSEAATDTAMRTQNVSRFTGLGPLLGIDANYGLIRNLSAVAHIDAALLIGNIQSTLKVYNSEDGGDEVFNSFKDGPEKRVVPAIDAKLGLNYEYALDDDKDSNKLILEAGWVWGTLFDSVDGVAGSVSADPARLAGHGSADASLQGPYATLAVAF